MAARKKPYKISTPSAFDKGIDRYLEHIKKTDEPITLTGALNFLGIYGKATLYKYQERAGFDEPVKRLRQLVESAYERKLHGTTAAGAIFALKNMGWTDRTETQLTGANGGPIEYRHYTDSELDKRIAELQARATNDDSKDDPEPIVPALKAKANGSS